MLFDLILLSVMPQERQERRGDGRRPSRAEQRLRSLFEAGANAGVSPEPGAEVRVMHVFQCSNATAVTAVTLH